MQYTENILVVGGAGYIGAHMVRILQENGLKPIVLDSLEHGHAEAVGGAELIIGDIGNRALLNEVFTSRSFAGVMHFASYIQVGESVTAPAKYYDNNVSRTLCLLDAMVENKVDNFIFSSTAAIFGNPEYTPINEAHPKNPINPYGRSKLMVEQILADYEKAYGLKYGCLRYFNAAGAIPDGSIGESHEPETHLIPLVLQAASGRRSHISIYGDDYPTLDGTCIRDYIHICDLGTAHLLLLRAFMGGMNSASFNLGTGEGYSILQVIETACNVTNQEISTVYAPRRAGDPAVLIADGSAGKEKLGWRPELSDLETIIRHAWQWEQKLAANKAK